MSAVLDLDPVLPVERNALLRRFIDLVLANEDRQRDVAAFVVRCEVGRLRQLIGDASQPVMEPVSAKAVFDMFFWLSPEDRIACLRMIGGTMRADVMKLFVAYLPLPEQMKFWEGMSMEAARRAIPRYLIPMRKLLAENPNLPDEQFWEKLSDSANETVGEREELISEVARQRHKSERDPKVREVVRNNEILDRLDNKETGASLSRHYEIAESSISRIKKERAKWRALRDAGKSPPQ